MDAKQVLAAIARKYPEAAVVPELAIEVNLIHPSGRVIPSVRRIDALMIEPSDLRTAIEVKVSKADVDRESYGKIDDWWRVCNRFIYAVPAGLIDRPPIQGTGLWWIHEDGKVEVRRNARVSKNPEPLPLKVIRNIAYRASHGAAKRFRAEG